MFSWTNWIKNESWRRPSPCITSSPFGTGMNGWKPDENNFTIFFPKRIFFYRKVEDEIKFLHASWAFVYLLSIRFQIFFPGKQIYLPNRLWTEHQESDIKNIWRGAAWMFYKNTKTFFSPVENWLKIAKAFDTCYTFRAFAP